MGIAPARGRGGFTLVELLIAMVLIGMIGAVTMRIMVRMQRGSRAQSQRVTLQGNMRAGIALLPSELREVTPSDILAAAPDRIQYRAMRATGIACQVTSTQIRLRNTLTFKYRDIQPARDGMYLFLENDPAKASDDEWRELAITASTGSTCPDGAAATALTVVVAATSGAISAADLAKVDLEAPVRTFEVMEFRLYESEGRFWLGGQSISTAGSTVEPVLGPLTADGLLFTYRDSVGNITATLPRIRTIEITLNGETDSRISTGSSTTSIVEDSLTARVRLRNAPSF